MFETLLSQNVPVGRVWPVHFPVQNHMREVTHRAVRQLQERTGLAFLGVDADSGCILARSSNDVIDLLPLPVRSQLGSVTGPRVIELRSGLVFYVVPLSEVSVSQVVAVGHVLHRPVDIPHEVRHFAAEQQWSDEQLEEWLTPQHHASPDLIERLLVATIGTDLQQAELCEQVETLKGEVERSCEDLSVLHRLTASLNVSRSVLELAEQAAQALATLVAAEGVLVVLEDHAHQRQAVCHGDVPFDPDRLEELVAGFANHRWSRPLICNDLPATRAGRDFPGIRNLMLARISDGIRSSGWILLCNLPEGSDFSCVEAGLVRTGATILSTQHQNQQLYREQEELLLQFVNSLVSTLDARDSCTRGHSERVARIAHRIGEELRLPPAELDDLHQCGLLHDIGKIGVHDSVLLKQGALTPEEFDEIKQHPLIGVRILSGLHSLKRLLPGVRNHHESLDGRGYPDGLAGDEIPLMARILAVADAYDAMSSNRPYRNGMPQEAVESVLRARRGVQWDPVVVDACFNCWSDLDRIVSGSPSR